MDKNLIILTVSFGFIAFFYSMVGFGGGSSYIALLILFAIPHTDAPLIALTCNLIVVSGGVIHFYRGGHLNPKLLLPLILTSIPFAFWGGSITIQKNTYQLILAACLLVIALKMIFYKKQFNNKENISNLPPLKFSLPAGAILGFISGLVGIGGGIFLAPILYAFRWGKPKEIATVAASFIFVNSIAGLIGQLTKYEWFNITSNYWTLFLAVFLFGQVGSYFGSFQISARKIEIFTATLILVVSTRLFINLI